MSADVPMIACDAVTKRFGGINALVGVNLVIRPHNVTSIIGPNGAGKSTLLNIICGLDRPTSGSVRVAGESIDDYSPHLVAARLRLARTFQTPRIFRSLSARENVRVAASRHMEASFLRGIFRPRRNRRHAENVEKSEHWLEYLGLHDRGHVIAGVMSYGEQRRLELARALATDPRCLLLDEPGAGLNDTERGELAEILGRIGDLRVSIVLVDHSMDLVMQVSDEVAVLDQGRVLAVGRPADIQRDPAVIEAYLGGTRSA